MSEENDSQLVDSNEKTIHINKVKHENLFESKESLKKFEELEKITKEEILS